MILQQRDMGSIPIENRPLSFIGAYIMVNKVILIGNLGRDPKSVLTNGNEMSFFSVATTESWKSKQTGLRESKTEWHNVSVFNENLAKFANKYLKKGSKIYLEGKLETREVTNKEGQLTKVTEVILTKFNGELVSLSSENISKEQNKTNISSEDDEIPF